MTATCADCLNTGRNAAGRVCLCQAGHTLLSEPATSSNPNDDAEAEAEAIVDYMQDHDGARPPWARRRRR